MDAEPTHRRTITIESFDTDDGLVMRGHLVDERPWMEAADQTRVLHSMHLDLTIDPATMEITDAFAQMTANPHEECRTIEPAFRALVGLSVTRGYNRAVQERLGRERGCSHLEFLARAMGPAAVQASASTRRRRGENFVSAEGSTEPSAWLVNTCHLWGAGGVGAEKMKLGWRPGVVRYPTPSLVTLRRERAAEDH